MDTLATIKNLGLDEHETQIYLKMLEIGGAPASAIAKVSGVKRTTIYPILQKMRNEGFVRVYLRDDTKYFYAQKPRRVAANYGKKLDALYAIVPQLEALERIGTQETGLRYIETLAELREFYTDILSEYQDKEYCIIGSAQGWEDLDNQFFRQYRKDRARNYIRTRILLTHESQIINPVDPQLLREVRYLPSEYSFRSTIDIYEDKVLIVSPDLSALAVVIQIPAVMDIFRSMFEMLWISRRPVDDHA